MRPTAQRCLPWPGNTLPGPWRISRRQRCNTLGFTSNARATSPTELPRSSRCTAASLNSFVNILFDNPMTHSPFQWILSLNWLCQKWGQVQARDMVLTAINQLWRADITYIRLRDEFVFLAVILDAYSRRVIGWALDRTMED